MRLAPLLAAAISLAVIFAVLGPPATFHAPVAAAAERLTTIKTLYIERLVTQGGRTARERIWYEAPRFLRIERTSSSGTDLEIDRPGQRFRRTSSGETLQTGLPPSADVLPEPVSPTVELLGVREGPGPAIDGVPTVLYELSFDNGVTRTAYVADGTYVALGVDNNLILQKESPNEASTTTRVATLRVNEPIDPSMFEIPRIAATDVGYRTQPLASFPVVPAALPAGFRLVSAASSPEGDVALFARGALSIELDLSPRLPTTSATSRSIDATIGSTPATIVDDLYALPRITFPLAGRWITIAGPLDHQGLIDTARAMFAL